MNLIRYEPAGFPMFREMEETLDRMNRFFGRPNGNKENLIVTDWTPTCDIQETEGEYLIKAELPEVKKEDVKVTVENGVLTLQGDRKQEKEEKGKKFHRVERSYGKFVRRFALPTEIDAGSANAEFKDGVLTVRVPKAAVTKPKTIEVKVA